MEIRSMPYREYHDTADRILEKAGWKRTELPVDIEQLLSYLDIAPWGFDNLMRDHGTRATLLRSPYSEYQIAIDSYHWEQQPESAVFTLAEELAHWEVHSWLFQEVRSVEDAISIREKLSDRSRAYLEQQARNIGTCLLLPRHLFPHYVHDYVRRKRDLLRRVGVRSPRALAERIAHGIGTELRVSEWVVKLILTGRYPEPLLMHSAYEVYQNG